MRTGEARELKCASKACELKFANKAYEVYWSYSRISTYLRCPRQFEHRYLLHTDPEFQPSVLVFGSAVHEALAAFYGELMDERPAPPADALAVVFSDSWARRQEDDVPILFGDNETADSLNDAGVRLIEVFAAQAAVPHDVLGVEKAFRVQIVEPDTGEVLPPLVGFFDAVVLDQDGHHRILEHKTAARRWAQARKDNDLQLSAYSLAASLLGLEQTSVSVQILLKQKKPAFEVFSPDRTTAHHRDFIETAFGVHRAVEAEAFYPVRDWFCPTCPYVGACSAKE